MWGVLFLFISVCLCLYYFYTGGIDKYAGYGGSQSDRGLTGPQRQRSGKISVHKPLCIS